MVIYEVNLILKNDIRGPFEAWLKEHIEEMLSFTGFLDAKVFHISAPGDEINPQNYTIHYYLDSTDSLKNYLENGAFVMRQKGLSRFAEQFSADRRMLYPFDLQ